MYLTQRFSFICSDARSRCWHRHRIYPPDGRCGTTGRKIFAAKEAEILRSLSEHQKQQAFFNCWTRKEAYVKACGAGLSQPLNQFEVSLIPGEPAKLLSIAGLKEAAANWQLQDLKAVDGYAGAIALSGKDWQIHCWQWL